jgi:hypothetical protein
MEWTRYQSGWWSVICGPGQRWLWCSARCNRPVRDDVCSQLVHGAGAVVVPLQVDVQMPVGHPVFDARFDGHQSSVCFPFSQLPPLRVRVGGYPGIHLQAPGEGGDGERASGADGADPAGRVAPVDDVPPHVSSVRSRSSGEPGDADAQFLARTESATRSSSL